MPLRGFLYFADLYKKYIKDVELSARRLIKIPTPHYVVFYNGTERQEEEFEQLLSNAFENEREGCMELKVRTININYGHNKELLEKCGTLAGYAYLVVKIRSKLGKKPGEDEVKAAVVDAVEECIQEGVLKDFLLEQKSEVISMSIYEYNEEYARKAFYEDGAEAGYAQGKEDGIDIGKDIGYAKCLLQSVETLMKKLSCSVQEACDSIGVTMEEYNEALTIIREK